MFQFRLGHPGYSSFMLEGSNKVENLTWKEAVLGNSTQKDPRDNMKGLINDRKCTSEAVTLSVYPL